MITITKRQEQIIHATILGGSSLVYSNKSINPYLSMRSKNNNWLQFKSNELKNIISPSPFTLEKTNRWHSKSISALNDMYDSFYDQNKNRKLNKKILDLLTDFAFSIWYGDAGSFKNGKIILNTNVWGENGTQIIESYFKDIGYECSVFLSRECYRVRLDKDSSKEFFSLASPHFPPFLYYKC